MGFLETLLGRRREAPRTNPKALNKDASRCFERGDYDQAIALLDRVIEQAPHLKTPLLAAAHHNRGRARQKKGDLTHALDDCESAIRLAPGKAIFYASRGAMLFDSGQIDRALADLDHAIRIEPSLAIAYFNRGFVWLRKRDPQQARADFDAALRLEPMGPDGEPAAEPVIVAKSATRGRFGASTGSVVPQAHHSRNGSATTPPGDGVR